MDEREEVKQLASEINVGSTLSVVCPWCLGGSSKDKSFRVTRNSNDGVLYVCHRAKCGVKGALSLVGPMLGFHHKVNPVQFQPNPYQKPCTSFDIEDLEYLVNTYKLDLDKVIQAGWMKPHEEYYGDFKVIMPVFGPLGGLRGHHLRLAYRDKSKNKQCKSYKLAQEPWQCWYRISNSEIVVVEDQISALRITDAGRTGVAMLGTGLSEDKFIEIATAANGKKVWLAFDKDAGTKSIEALRRYRILYPNLFALMLSKDIKDMNDEELKELFK